MTTQKLDFSIQEQLKLIINQHMPNLVGKELQEFIQDANQNVDKIVELKAKLDKAQETINAQILELNSHSSMQDKLQEQARAMFPAFPFPTGGSSEKTK